MQALLDVILPVFLLIGAGYAVAWRGILSEAAIDGLMDFTQKIAVPCLLFHAIARLDLGQDFDLRLIAAFYTGALVCFLAGLFGARLLFGRPWEDAVVIGFCALFSNSLMLGLPITERAYGADALAGNFTIIALHSPVCYFVGIMTMEIVRSGGSGAVATLGRIGRGMATNALVVAIGLGFAVNLSGIATTGALWEALGLVVRTAIPVALVALGGVLFRYRPEGDLRTIAFVCTVSLGLHPAIVWTLGQALALSEAGLRSAVITASVAPGVNAYVFANLYGRAKRVAASSVLIGTALTALTALGWIALLP